MPEHIGRKAAPRLLLITPPGSYRTPAYLASARRQGVDVLVASEGRYSLVSEIASGLHVDLTDPASLKLLLQANEDQSFTGVVATDDSAVELASQLAEALGLPHNPPRAASISRYKHLSRQTLAAAESAQLKVPVFRLVDLSARVAPQLAGLDLPVVVKPLSLSGSRGVIRANTLPEVAAACLRLQGILADESINDAYLATHVLLEEYIAGPEVAVEGLLSRGKLDVLAIFDKPDPLEGPYFEETYYITPSRHESHVQQQIIQCVTAACHGIGLREGPVHAEIRIGNSGCAIIEVASRTIGGECARLLDFGTGHCLEDLVIAHAIGRPLTIESGEGAAGVLMIPIPGAGILRRIEGVSAARAVPFIDELLISIRTGYELVPLPEGSSYLGFMFARAPTPEQVERALRTAHAMLKIVVAPLLKIVDNREQVTPV